MVVTDNPDWADQVRCLRVHGSQPKYYHKWIGINSRLDAIQAAILLAKFRHLEEWTTERQRKAHRYREQFEDLMNLLPHFESPTIQYSNRHIFNQFVIRVPKRDGLRKYLQQEGIGTEIYYPLPLHMQECFAYLKHQRGDFPISERAANETLALPIYPEMTDDQQAYVVSRVRSFYEKVKPKKETP